MLLGPPGALQCALRLCKSILRCSWKHLQWWRCFVDATRLTVGIVKFLRRWDLSAELWETSEGAETTAQALQETYCHIVTAVVQGEGSSGVHMHSFLLQFLFCSIYLSTCICQLGWMLTGGVELHHLTGSPCSRGGVFRSCHTPVLVNTVWINTNSSGS